MTLIAPSGTEVELAAQLRDKVLRFIDASGLNEDSLAERLGIAPQTVKRLLRQQVWDLRLAASIADRLDLPVRFA